MPRHVVFLAVVIYYCWFGLVLLFVVLDGVVESVGAVWEFFYAGVYRGFYLWVFAEGPVVLVTDICPSYFLVKVIITSYYFGFHLCLLFNSLLLFFICFYFWLHISLLLILFLLIFLIEFFSAVQIGPVRSPPVMVEPKIPNLHNFFIGRKLLHIICTLWKRQFANLIPVHLHKVLLIRDKKFWEICLLVLIEFVMLLLCFESI